MPPIDEHHGEPGSYKVNSAGKRELVKGSRTEQHEEGDAPRDKDGKRLDRGADHKEAAKPQSALPEPAKGSPWDKPAETPAADDASSRRASTSTRSKPE